MVSWSLYVYSVLRCLFNFGKTIDHRNTENKTTPKICRITVFVFSRTTKIQFKDKLSARSLFVHLLKYSIKFTIMKAQYLSNVEIIIFSSLIIFCVKSHVGACRMSVCSWDKNTNLVEHKHCEPETDFATVLNSLSPKCLLTLFCFQVIFMTCVEDNRIASFKLKLVKRKVCFSKTWLGTAINTFSWMTTGNVKMVAPTESTHVCAPKKIIWKLKKKKKTRKRTLDIHLKTSKHRIGTYKK